MKDIITFDHFKVTQDFGSVVQRVDDSMIESWKKIYGDNGVSADSEIPEGMMQALAMRAFLNLVTPRPPGNIHLGQTMRLHAVANLDDLISVSVVCAGKQIRKERKIVQLAVSGRTDRGKAVFDGEMTLIWAA